MILSLKIKVSVNGYRVQLKEPNVISTWKILDVDPKFDKNCSCQMLEQMIKLSMCTMHFSSMKLELPSTYINQLRKKFQIAFCTNKLSNKLNSILIKNQLRLLWASEFENQIMCYYIHSNRLGLEISICVCKYDNSKIKLFRFEHNNNFSTLSRSEATDLCMFNLLARFD
ncbi:hypothetical protein BpHYR1_001443 [Brachionus plicatilis]|uniref:Uncharacterized protein n=1 Tax=Brachionus plicatilis TaxID=10195 RepID=A0A3M7PHJ5_BRAPC|nr:hypothetical protein BpHYR1_001443 [Brachionus plicatilis]